MIEMFGTIRCRWHRMGRRLFFLHCSLVVVGLLLALPARTGAQELPSARILQRQARVMRNESGMYRVIEAMLIELDREVPADFVLPEPLGLVVVKAVTGSVMGIGGDVPVTQIVYDEPQITIVGPVGLRTLEIAVTYALARDAAKLEFTAPLPVEEFLVEIDRGSIDFLPAGRLSEGDAGGTDERPVVRYEATTLEAGEVVGLNFSSSHVSWQQRIAVLIAIGLTAIAAGVAVWRRAAGRPSYAA